MRILRIAIGAFAVLLGGLWLVQGLGIVTLQPVACATNCETLEGPSTTWAIVGFLVLAGGVFLLASARRAKAE